MEKRTFPKLVICLLLLAIIIAISACTNDETNLNIKGGKENLENVLERID